MGRKASIFGLIVCVVLLETTGCSKVKGWLGGSDRVDAKAANKPQGKRPKKIDGVPGDFRSRCKSCAIKDNRLTCVCGGLQSSIDLPCGFVSVMDRALACPSFPKGNYANTCRDCFMRRDNSQVSIDCECASGKGEWKRATQPLRLNALSCGHVTNENGVLTCAKQPLDGGQCQFPNGSYAMSCGHCSLACDSQTTMTCTCAPSETPNTITLQTCPSGLVSNDNGTLKCDPAPQPKAPQAS
jgi:hypothetical protein